MTSRTSGILALLAPLCFAAAACGGGESTASSYPDPPADEPVDNGPSPAVDPPDNANAPIVCGEAEGVYAATKEPSNVLFLVDRSGSMQIKLSNGDTRWTATKRGLFDLLAELPPTTQAGAMMFPQGDAPVTFCSIDSKNEVYCAPGPARPPKYPRCDAATYTVGVANDALQAKQVDDIKNYVSTADTEFYYGTPLAFALSGAIDAQRASTLPGAKSVILLTDGNPTDCNNPNDPDADNVQNVIDVAAAGVSGNTLVRTFVMGVIDGTKGASAENLSPIAKAGGTGRTQNCDATHDCFYAINAATFQADIKKAFEEVSLQAFDCTFNMPPQGKDHDPQKTNVTLTTSGGGTVTVGRDTNHQDGWDYLPNGTQIQLYGQACTDMKSDANAKVDIVIGCKAVVVPTTK